MRFSLKGGVQYLYMTVTVYITLLQNWAHTVNTAELVRSSDVNLILLQPIMEFSLLIVKQVNEDDISREFIFLLSHL